MPILNFKIDPKTDYDSIRNHELYGKPLSDRETEILVLIATKGLSRSEIAKELSISPYTVRNQVFSIFDKLNINNNVQVAIVYLTGEIPSDMIKEKVSC